MPNHGPTGPRLVSFEGIDGAGKSTLIAAVAVRLKDLGADPVVTREETSSWLGDAVKTSIREHLDPLATLFLFLADRAHHLDGLRPALAAGRIVLTDRYHDSTRAYQGVTLGGRIAGLDDWLRDVSAPWLVRPARTYLVDIDPAVAMRRMDARAERSNYEKEAFLEKVRTRFLDIAAEEPDRFVVLDGTLSTAQLVKVIVADLERARIVMPDASVAK